MKKKKTNKQLKSKKIEESPIEKKKKKISTCTMGRTMSNVE